MKRVYIARHPADAHLLADLLEFQGIPAATQNMKYGWYSVTPGTLVMNPRPSPSVWVVEDADFDRAMTLVEEYRRSEDLEPAATWACPTCGECIEAAFDTCWKCHAPSDENPPV